MHTSPNIQISMSNTSCSQLQQKRHQNESKKNECNNDIKSILFEIITESYQNYDTTSLECEKLKKKQKSEKKNNEMGKSFST